MKMFIQKQSMICMEIGICYVHILYIMFLVLLNQFWSSMGRLFPDDFCGVVLSGMSVVNIASQKSHINRRHSFIFVYRGKIQHLVFMQHSYVLHWWQIVCHVNIFSEKL